MEEADEATTRAEATQAMAKEEDKTSTLIPFDFITSISEEVSSSVAVCPTLGF